MMLSMWESSSISNLIDPREAIEYFLNSSKEKSPGQIAKVYSRNAHSIYEIMDKRK